MPYGSHGSAAARYPGRPQLRQRPRVLRHPRPDRDPDPTATSASSSPTSPPEKRDGLGPRRRPPRDLPDRELRQDAHASSTSGTSSGKPRYDARRVPPAAPDLRPAVPRLAAPRQGAAGRGRGLPRRHADHDRRRRVHHQRRRARRRQPAAPLARRRLRRRDRGRRHASCTPAAIIPERGSWIELNVTKKDTLGVRIDQSGKFSAMTLLRAMRPEYCDRRRRSCSRSTRSTTAEGRRRPQRRQARGQDRRRRRRRSRRASAPARSSSRAGSAITKNVAEIICTTPASSRSRSSDAPKTPLILNIAARTTTRRATKRRCCRSTSGCGPATRRSSRRPASSSTRSSSTPTATASAASAASASTASSTRTSPKTEMTLQPRGLRQRDPLHPRACAQRRGPRRRHRPPGQPPPAHDRRAGRRRAPQGLPEAPPHRPGAHEPQGRRRT